MQTLHTLETLTTDEADHDEPYQDIKIKAGSVTICKVFIDDAPVHDFNAMQRANARRLVACWNACNGIATDVLEKGRVSPDAFEQEESRADRAELQRDELLAALTRLANAAFARDITMGDQCSLFAAQAELRDATKQAREVIAAARKAQS